MSTLVGTVAALARFPVKTMAGEAPEWIELDRRGVRHDRGWAVYLPDGAIASGKSTRRFRKVPGLLGWRSALGPDGTPMLYDPAGTGYRAGEPAADAALTEAFGRPLALRPEGAVPHHDDAGLHLVTTGSLAAAGELAGGRIDPRRTRANLVVDTAGAAGFVEEGWHGELAVGAEAVLSLGPGMPRCAMIDQPQHAVPRGVPLLRELGRQRDLLLGLQAEVRRPGTVRLGDEVRLLG